MHKRITVTFTAFLYLREIQQCVNDQFSSQFPEHLHAIFQPQIWFHYARTTHWARFMIEFVSKYVDGWASAADRWVGRWKAVNAAQRSVHVEWVTLCNHGDNFIMIRSNQKLIVFGGITPCSPVPPKRSSARLNGVTSQTTVIFILWHIDPLSASENSGRC
jgi:hypothetical protein